MDRDRPTDDHTGMNGRKNEEYYSSLEDQLKEQERELKNYETVLNTLFENAADGILITDTEGIIINTNRRACEMFGKNKDTLRGATIGELEKEQNRLIWEERLHRMLNNESLMFESEYIREDGSRVYLEVTSKMIRIGGMDLIQAFYRDISEKKKLLAELLHSQRMESMGVLAGGVAHDFGNILTVILSYLDVIYMSKEVPDDISQHLKIIENAARQGTHVVSQILAYAKREGTEFVPFSVNKVVSETLDMMSHIVPKQIALTQDLDNTIPPVDGDEARIEQVLMNLIINARDAMPDGGEIIISTRPTWLKNGDIDIPAEISAGRYINITVKDNGCGIPEDRLPHIFQPFYTTKETGTGLGLAIVYGLIKDHGGYVTAENNPGQGTAFNIYLPVSRRKTAVIEGEETGSSKVPGTILVVDDEVLVLTLVKDILSETGFQVIAYDDPAAALEFYRTNSKRIALAIIDIVMPVIDGASLVKHMKEIEPGTKTMAITGFSKNIDTAVFDGFLRKPFKSHELLSTIKKITGSDIAGN